MVVICSSVYPVQNIPLYEHYYKAYSYNLHDFQKWCVEAIYTSNHLLVCRPTGSGKTFAGEFALTHLHSKGKKTIYTTPIKALSNEKFHAFTLKYPHISFGLITGDIKTNPDADVLIMTTEILLNKLINPLSTSNNSHNTTFDIDIINELGCVVFDEIHYIGDENRGYAYEMCLMLLLRLSHIQIVGLSATLDNPDKFATWLETKGNGVKKVYLTQDNKRAVPLVHYAFLASVASINKTIKDKTIQDEIMRITREPLLLQDATGKFNEITFNQITKTIKLLEKHNISIKRQHVLNMIAKHLTEKEMLPAICYVFSRKQLERCANEMTTNILEFDSKIPYTVDRECETIIRKLPNYEEYLHLPEYIQLVKLLRKGVAIHHAGMMPILREMVELLFTRGFVKLLFCTETMSVGINLPVKTTIFTDIHKYDGNIIRTLYSHEYTQAAGRAGRLGYDKFGYVIHLNNLFPSLDLTTYKKMMNGKPQSLCSHFKVSYNFVLNQLSGTRIQASDSMYTDTLNRNITSTRDNINELKNKRERLLETIKNTLRTPLNCVERYIELSAMRGHVVNKQRRAVEKELTELTDNHRHIETDKSIVLSLRETNELIVTYESQLQKYVSLYDTKIQTIINVLYRHQFLKNNEQTTAITTVTEQQTVTMLTSKGDIARQLKELHCLTFAELIETEKLNVLSSNELVMLFGCLTNVTVSDNLKSHNVSETIASSYPNLKTILCDVSNAFEYWKSLNANNQIDEDFEYDLNYDLIDYLNEWCKVDSIETSKIILEKIGAEKNIFLGEFVKAILKINNITNELMTIAETSGNIQLLHNLSIIPSLTLKFVVTNQSLYV